MKNVAVRGILLPLQRRGRCLSLAPGRSPVSSRVSEPWRPSGAEPPSEGRQMLGERQDGNSTGSVSIDPISFLLCLHLLDD